MQTNLSPGRIGRPCPEGLGPSRRPVFDRRLLVVEDDADLWPILERIGGIVDRGLRIDFAPDADRALYRLMSEERYKAVLADVLLPGDHGGYWLRSMCDRYQPWAGFAMMSSSPKLEGFDALFLPKPFSIRQAIEFMQDLVL